MMSDMTPVPPRDSLRARIEAAERRNAERTLADQAREAAETATDFARTHPLTVIGGALAVGLVIGLATRPGRQVAGKAVGAVGATASGVAGSAAAGVKSVTARGGSRVATLLGEAAMAYAMKLLDELLSDVAAGQDRLEGFGEDVGSTARSVGQKAAGALGSAADTTRAAASKTRRKAASVVAGATRKVKG
jgi:ElaB/YqjD/DUF883 family membrane-anchored ribosome-binding protein